jgi:hypothetical protein
MTTSPIESRETTLKKIDLTINVVIAMTRNQTTTMMLLEQDGVSSIKKLILLRSNL